MRPRGYRQGNVLDQIEETDVRMPVDASRNKWDGKLDSVTSKNGFTTRAFNSVWYDFGFGKNEFYAFFAVYASAEPNLPFVDIWSEASCTTADPVTEGPADPDEEP